MAKKMPQETNDSIELVEFETRLLAARLDRASQHFEAFGETWAKYLDGKPHSLIRRREPDGTFVVRLHRAVPLPVELSIEFGELLYELRSALDNCLYAVAVITSKENPPPDAHLLEWPIHQTAEGWKSSARRYRSLPFEVVSALEAIQPYQAAAPGWNCLALLHDLARLDRHRSPHRLGLFLSDMHLKVDLDQMEIVKASERGLIEEGDEIVRVRMRKGGIPNRDNFDLDLEFDVDATDVQEKPGPSGESGRPWGSLDDRLRALITATRDYSIDLIDLAGDYAANASRPGVPA